MTERLKRLLQSWALSDWSAEEEAILGLGAVRYLGREVLGDYEPSQFDKFDDRLDRWLHNVAEEEDQKALFRLLNHLFFVGRPEFESLCRAAFSGNVQRWLVDRLNIDLEDPAASESLQKSLSGTWFCPITDSMRINWFLKVNNLSGMPHRPDWRSLRRFGDRNRIRDFVGAKQIQRLVLLEDFVGSGTQIRKTVSFAAETLSDIALLVLPLIICPDGDCIGRQLDDTYANVTYDPLLVIPSDMFIKAEPVESEPALFQAIRELIVRMGPRLDVRELDAKSRQCHGYKGTGAVVAMFSNCPNNTLPIVHNESADWRALFPRINRI